MIWLKNKKFKFILDIGANEGQFAEKFVALFPEATFICFEPLAEPLQKLKERFKDRNNFQFHQLALGNETGKNKIFRNEYSPSSSLLPMKKNHKEAFTFTEKDFEEEIEIKKLDEILNENDIAKPYLVKIDVQGFEIEVIKGGQNIISNAEMIILETSFVQLYEGAPLFDDIYELLKSLSFEYIGSFEQLERPQDGKILQQDSIFIKKGALNE